LPPTAYKNLSGSGLLAIALTAVVLISPTFFLGQISGNDFNFHIASWMEVVHQWHQHVLFPSWAAGAYNGYGEPRFIFYPPISWLVGAALGLVLPWKIVPDVFLFLTFALAGISMRRLARRWMSQEAALATALIYMTNPYFLVDLYVRSPSAELLAAAILPLAILCVLNCAPGGLPGPADESVRARCRNIALLAVAYAAIWLTNAPMAVVTSYTFAFLLIVLAAYRRSLAPFLTGGAGLALGLLLSSAYIIPATFEQRWVSIGEAITGGLVFTDALIFKWISDPQPDHFAIVVSVVSAFEIVVAVATAMTLRKRTGKTGAAWIAFFALAVLSALIMLPLTGSLLQYLPKMRFIQFPWRWLIPLGISFAFFLGSAIATSRRRLAIGFVYLAILAGEATLLCTKFSWWDSRDVPDTLLAIKSGEGYEGTGEYGPRLGDPAKLVETAPLVYLYPEGTRALATAPPQTASGIISIASWLDQHKDFTVASRAPVVAAVHLLNYPAWRVRVNDVPAASDTDPDSGQMLLRLPSGINNVEIQFSWTPDRTLGCALSGVGILLLSCIVVFGWSRDPARAR
jgi:hypothetical protein